MQNIRGEDQAAYWNQRAKEYNSQYGQDTPTSRLKVQRKVAMMFDYGRLYAHDNVLEVGCGTGTYTREIAPKLQSRLTAIDISKEMIEKAIDYVSKEEMTRFSIMDARNLKFEKEFFDVVISTFLLQHVETNIVIPEMRRVLKIDGKFIAIVPNILNPIHYSRAKRLFNETSHSVDFNRWQWKKLLTKYNFTDIRIYPVEFTSPYVPESLAKFSIKISSLLEKIPIIREFAGSLLIIAQKK